MKENKLRFYNKKIKLANRLMKVGILTTFLSFLGILNILFFLLVHIGLFIYAYGMVFGLQSLQDFLGFEEEKE